MILFACLPTLFEDIIKINQNYVCSVRVSNELGAGNARAAKFSVVVVSITTVLIGVVCMAVVLATKDIFPYLFTNSDAVAKETTRLSILLALTVLLNGLQPVLSGKNSTSHCIRCMLPVIPHTQKMSIVNLEMPVSRKPMTL